MANIHMTEVITDHKLCDYCNTRLARYISRAGKYCCENKWERCPESRRKAKNKSNLQWKDPKIVEKSKKSAEIRWKKEKEKILQSIRMKKRHVDYPEIAEKVGLINKKRFENIEERIKHGEYIKKAYENPKVKEKASKSQKKRFEKIEELEKLSRAGKNNKGKKLRDDTKRKISISMIKKIKIKKENILHQVIIQKLAK